MRFFPIFLLFPFFLQSQNISGIINSYQAAMSLDTCSGAIEVADAADFPKGTRIIMAQMQGATINQSNSASFGTVSDLGGAGLTEVNEIDSISGMVVFLKNRPRTGFDISGKIQLVTYPIFANATVTDSLYAQAWDGSTGGILAFEVNGNLTVNAPIAADGAGFWGGAPFFATDNNCSWATNQNDRFYPAGSWRGGNKGHGIAAIQAGFELGRGNQANGGGGGNDHNSGGGGGANRSFGGQGGENDEPSFFGCDGAFAGQAGGPISTNDDRFFMGGGGGAGHSNNQLVGAGGNGGGLIFIQTNTLMGSVKISANGLNGGDASGDGGGGGGAGGHIYLMVQNDQSASLDIEILGGHGGNTNNNNQDRCFGPGGGGGGGVSTSNLAILANAGGTSGTVLSSSNGCNGSKNGAANGANGTSLANLTLPVASQAYGGAVPAIINQPLSYTICENELVTFICGATGPIENYLWQEWNGSNWVTVPNMTPYAITGNQLQIVSPSLALNGSQYRCVVDFGTCAGSITSDPAFLDVSPQPDANFTASSNGQTVTFTNLSQNYDLAFWEFGDGMTSVDINPIHTYTSAGAYTAELTVWNACDTVIYTQNLSFQAMPVAAFTIPDTLSNCGSVNADFTNMSQGMVDSIKWLFPNATPSTSTAQNVNVSFPQSGNYSASLIAFNGAGSDTLIQNFYVDIMTPPDAQFVFSQNGNQITFDNQSANYIFVSWTFGDGSANTMEENPSHTYTENGVYVVTLAASNACGASILQQNIEITGLVATNHFNIEKEVALYPNPTDSDFYVKISDSNLRPSRLSLFSSDSKLMKTQILDGTASQKINVNGFSNGVYFVKIEMESGVVVWKKVVVN